MKFSNLLLLIIVMCHTGCQKPVFHSSFGTTIMTFNLLYNSQNNKDSIAAIKEANPDIVCLRELTPKFAKIFHTHLKTQYPHTIFKKRNGTWGAGIASKFPILKSDYFPVKPHRLPGLEAVLKTPKGDILLSCLHLFPPFGKHRESDGYFETKEALNKSILDFSEHGKRKMRFSFSFIFSHLL